MESNLQKSPMLVRLPDSSDAESVSGLSTVLVATIQEAKDKISQIEYIFFCQLYPNFKLKCRSLEKMYSEAKAAAKDECKAKQEDLLLQIEKLQCEKEQILQENHSLKLEKENFMNTERESCNRLEELQKELKQKTTEVNEEREAQQNLQKLVVSKASLIHSYANTVKELEEKKMILMKKQKNLEVETKALQLELMKKSKDADDIMELQKKLLQINQSNATLIMQKEMQLKESEEKANRHISELEDVKKKVNELLSQLREKTEELDKGKDLQGDFLKKIEFQASEIKNKQQLLNKYEKENRLLATKVESLKNRVDVLQEELGKKTYELDEGRKLQEQLLQNSNPFNLEKIKREQEFEEERKQLHDKQKGLEEKVDKLQQSLCERTKESSEGIELHGKLLQQIRIKGTELLSEKKRRRNAVAAYKRLKSQYSFLCKKYDLNPQTTGHLNKIEEESEIIRLNDPPTSMDIADNASKSFDVANEVRKAEGKQEIEDKSQGVVSLRRLNPISQSTSRILITTKCENSTKACPPTGAKHSSSYWMNTRPHQSHVGPDPHDEFLDTPLKNLRENLGKVMKEHIPDFSKPGPVNTNLQNSGDEIQNTNANAGPQKLDFSPQKAGTPGFKYIAPVRKKSERESLRGVDCRQCKKFYDATLPDTGENTNVVSQNVRCEHINRVSRHRYRYAPPLTPEGFWNLGFESEM